MAHEAKLSLNVRPAIAQSLIQEGRLVSLIASGVRDDLPSAVLATSGVRLNTYVAFIPPDNFSRPTPSTLFTAPRTSTFYETGTWGNFVETDTFYRVGPSTLENPFLTSGWGLLAKDKGVYTVPSGCVVTSASLKIAGTLVKVSDDNTGRWEATLLESVAIGKVVDWEPSLDLYTFEKFV